MSSFLRNQRPIFSPTIKEHLLKVVLVRLDFNQLFGIKQIASEAQAEFISDFPNSSIEPETGYDIDVSDQKNPRVNIRESKDVYCFSDTSSKSKAKLSSSSLILENHEYLNFDHFHDQFQKFMHFIFKPERNIVFRPKRIGLRKINALVLPEMSPDQYEGYFSDKLLAHFSLPFVRDGLGNDNQAVTFKLPDDNCSVNLRFSSEFGLNKNTPSRRFILDLDVYSNSPQADVAECVAQLRAINEVIFDLFWHLIGEKTKKIIQGSESA